MSPPLNVSIRPIRPSQTHSLRHSVLWPDKPLAYVILDEDEHGWHFGAFLNSPQAGGGEGEEEEGPVAVISCFLEPLPEDLATGIEPPRTGRFRKFATAPELQHRGIGSALLRHTIAYLTAPELPDGEGGKGCTRLWCDARWEARGFYERIGMRLVRPDTAEGEGVEAPTFYKGKIPYVRMMLDVEDVASAVQT